MCILGHTLLMNERSLFTLWLAIGFASDMRVVLSWGDCIGLSAKQIRSRMAEARMRTSGIHMLLLRRNIRSSACLRRSHQVERKSPAFTIRSLKRPMHMRGRWKRLSQQTRGGEIECTQSKYTDNKDIFFWIEENKMCFSTVPLAPFTKRALS